METPVLSKKQQKKAISAKKGNKETVKNVLTIPFTHYWPLVNEDDAKRVREKLENLPKLLIQKPKVPWKDIKNIPTKERKEFRNKFITDPLPSLDLSAKEYLHFGVNEVTKSLETNEAGSVLIASDVNPQFMVKHIIDLSVLKNVPVLVIPELREVLKEKAGIASVCFCLKKDLKSATKLKEIYEEIKEVCINYPVPKQHVNYKRQEINNKKLQNEGEDLEYMEIKDSGPPIKKELFPEEAKEVEHSKSNEKKIDSSNFLSFSVDEPSLPNIKVDNLNTENKIWFTEDEPECGWYVQKKSSRQRAFIPEFHGEHDENSKTTVPDSEDFWSFETCNRNPIIRDDNTSETTVTGVKKGTVRYFTKTSKSNQIETKDKQYNSLKVKRIKNDKNRMKRKIEMLKKQPKKSKMS